MVASMGTTPAKPDNQPDQPVAGQPSAIPQPMAPAQPKSIRDYLNLARSQGQTPTFTNIEGGQGYNINNDPSMTPSGPQAIQEGPQNEYEKIPIGQRRKINPYIRAKQRVQTMLPELWQIMFPGMEQGAILDESQMKHWNGAVEAMTGNLLKKFDKEYDWQMKNEDATREQRSKEERHWQDVYVQAEMKQRPPLDPETGMPLSPQEFIDKQMAVRDEMKFQKEMKSEEDGAVRFEDLEVEQVSEVILANPELGKAIKNDVVAALSQIVGGQISDNDFNAMRIDPQWKETFDQEVRKALENRQEEIMQYMK